MPKVWHALLVAAVATGAAAIGWRTISYRRQRRMRLDSARARVDHEGERTQVEEIEALNAEQRELMLRELSGQV